MIYHLSSRKKSPEESWTGASNESKKHRILLVFTYVFRCFFDSLDAPVHDSSGDFFRLDK
jgi:hypothetical protein